MGKYLDKKFTLRGKVIFLLFFMISSEQLVSANHNNPIDSLLISIQLIQNVNRNIFHEFYESKNGVQVSLNTPFNLGNVQASLKLMPFLAKRQNNADFIIIQPNLKWGKNIYLSDKTTWFNSIGFGIVIFYFSDKQFSSIDETLFFVEKTESELVFSYSSLIRHYVNNNLQLNIEFSNDIIFTYKKINLVDICIGMSYSIKTPKWIKLILE